MKKLLVFLIITLLVTPLLIETVSAQNLKVKFGSRGLNESVSVNLTRFLGGSKTYVHSEAENVIIDIEEETGIATLRPRPYWRGVESIVFAVNTSALDISEEKARATNGTRNIVIQEGQVISEDGIRGEGGIPIGPEIFHILITPDEFMSNIYTNLIEGIPSKEIHNISGEFKNKELKIDVNQEVKIDIRYKTEEEEFLYKPEISISVLTHPEREQAPLVIKKGLFFPQIPFFEVIRAAFLLLSIALSILIGIYYKEDISLYITDITRIKDYLVRDPKKKTLIKLDFLRDTVNIGITEDAIEKTSVILKSYLIQNLKLKEFTSTEFNKKLKNKIISKELITVLQRIEVYKKRKPTLKQINNLLNEIEYIIKSL